MQWLCLFAVLLVLSQPAEAGKRWNAILTTIDKGNARVLEELAKVLETLANLTSQCTAKEVVKESKYIGCYEDKSARLLHKYLAIADMTNKKCVDACKAAGYKYAGTEVSTECFCGNCYDRYPKKSESECNFKCKGNVKELCGGRWRIRVSSTGI